MTLTSPRSLQTNRARALLIAHCPLPGKCPPSLQKKNRLPQEFKCVHSPAKKLWMCHCTLQCCRFLKLNASGTDQLLPVTDTASDPACLSSLSVLGTSMYSAARLFCMSQLVQWQLANLQHAHDAVHGQDTGQSPLAFEVPLMITCLQASCL